MLDDADVGAAVDVAIESMFYNQGEACTSTSRLLIHTSLYDEFASRFIDATEGWWSVTRCVRTPISVRW